MSQNIFQLWAANGKLLPFGARRGSWAERTVVIVEEIVLGKWPYGEAYGEVYVGGVKQPPLNRHIERSPAGVPSISCAGSYQWEFVEIPGLPRGDPIEMENGSGDDSALEERREWQKERKRAKKTKVRVLRRGDKIGFGAHRETKVEDMFRVRPSWVEWAIRNVNTFAVDPALMKELNPTSARERVSDQAVQMNLSRVSN